MRTIDVITYLILFLIVGVPLASFCVHLLKQL